MKIESNRVPQRLPSFLSSAPASTAAAPVDTFEAARAPAFTKPNYATVTAEKPGQDWNNLQLVYTVKRGDTLWDIAKKLGTTIEALTQWNTELAEQPDVIMPGKKIVAPSTFHIVRAGETYSGIARRTGLDPDVLMAFNGATSDRLDVGQEIQVPAAAVTAEQAAMRQKLKALMGDSARAFEQTVTGQNTTSTYDGGSSVGWRGPFESGIAYEYSDTFDFMRVWPGEEDSTPLMPLQDPVADTRRDVVKRAIQDVVWTAAYQRWEAKGDQNVPMPEGSSRELPDGRTLFFVDFGDGLPLSVTYDPKSEMATVDDSRTEPMSTIPASGAEATALKLGQLLGARMPSSPIRETPEQQG